MVQPLPPSHQTHSDTLHVYAKRKIRCPTKASQDKDTGDCSIYSRVADLSPWGLPSGKKAGNGNY